ncbi:MAG: response regulator [Spirochaetales bacterium]|nr:response regulator [Spirochaetales bacterium]
MRNQPEDAVPIAPRILLMEDDPLWAFNTKTALDALGYRVQYVLDADELREHIETFAPDILLVDIDLGPKTDGPDLARSITKERPDMPIVFFSGHIDEQTVERVADINHYGYVTKDAGPYVLDQMLRMALRLSAARKGKRESDDLFQSVVEESTDGIAMSDEEGRQILWNRAAAELTGIPATEALEQAVWDTFERLVPDTGSRTRSGRYEAVVKAWLKRGVPGEVTRPRIVTVRRDDGTVRRVEQRIFPIPGRGGLRLGALIRDVTRRVEAEEKVRALLREQTELLKESHERIHVDLDLVRSLLTVQRFQSHDAQTQGALHDAEQHITLLSRVYDRIYRSEDITAIPLKQLMDDLIVDLQRQSHGVRSGGDGPRRDGSGNASRRPMISLDVDRIVIARRFCLPVALIAWLLVDNVLARTPRGKAAGTVAIRIGRLEEDWLELVVAYDGDDLRPQDTTEGRARFDIELVATLAEQLNGAMTFENDGATIRITLQLPGT